MQGAGQLVHPTSTRRKAGSALLGHVKPLQLVNLRLAPRPRTSEEAMRASSRQLERHKRPVSRNSDCHHNQEQNISKAITHRCGILLLNVAQRASFPIPASDDVRLGKDSQQQGLDERSQAPTSRLLVSGDQIDVSKAPGISHRSQLDHSAQLDLQRVRSQLSTRVQTDHAAANSHAYPEI